MDAAKLRKLIAALWYNDRGGGMTEGLDPIRAALDADQTGRTRRIIEREAGKLSGVILGGLMFLLAERARDTGDVEALRRWFGSKDPFVRAAVLSALWSSPQASDEMRGGIRDLALLGMEDESPEVRTCASSVLFNLSGYRVDVSAALAPLLNHLKDRVPRVRHQAAITLGGIARKKFDVSKHIALLRKNLRHKDIYVREMTARSLGALCDRGHDIRSALPDLARLLTDAGDYNIPRKYAASSLLKHARKSGENAREVSEAVERLPIDRSRKELKKLFEYIEGVA